MTLVELFLWPGTKLCQLFGVEPEKDMGLIRSMFNMLVYLPVLLMVVWIIL